MQTSHPLFSVIPRLLRPAARIDAAEKRGNLDSKGEGSCRHHISPSASFRVFRGPLHAMMPLKTLKNAEIGTGKANRHADITPSFQRLSASSAANCTQ